MENRLIYKNPEKGPDNDGRMSYSKLYQQLQENTAAHEALARQAAAESRKVLDSAIAIPLEGDHKKAQEIPNPSYARTPENIDKLYHSVAGSTIYHLLERRGFEHQSKQLPYDLALDYKKGTFNPQTREYSYHIHQKQYYSALSGNRGVIPTPIREAALEALLSEQTAPDSNIQIQAEIHIALPEYELEGGSSKEILQKALKKFPKEFEIKYEKGKAILLVKKQSKALELSKKLREVINESLMPVELVPKVTIRIPQEAEQEENAAQTVEKILETSFQTGKKAKTKEIKEEKVEEVKEGISKEEEKELRKKQILALRYGKIKIGKKFVSLGTKLQTAEFHKMGEKQYRISYKTKGNFSNEQMQAAAKMILGFKKTKYAKSYEHIKDIIWNESSQTLEFTVELP